MGAFGVHGLRLKEPPTPSGIGGSRKVEREDCLPLSPRPWLSVQRRLRTAWFSGVLSLRWMVSDRLGPRLPATACYTAPVYPLLPAHQHLPYILRRVSLRLSGRSRSAIR